ncbi:MAG: hypothetical protein H6737_09700 [Alphaproteobacteria bacterium]|nr:hypothetical protein [Alphaproteobacteria bacterium]
MVPSDYRLDEVVARLIERLEGARPSYVDAASAEVAFRRIATEHVESAIAEYRVMMPGEPDLGRQEALLREEVLSTFLPRYLRGAIAMNTREAEHFGAGRLAEPAGRVGLVVAVLLLLLPMLRFVGYPVTWPIVLIVLSVPLWPDLIAWWARRRYYAELQRMIDDMQRIQHQATAYLPPEGTPTDDSRREAALRARQKEGEWRS